MEIFALIARENVPSLKPSAAGVPPLDARVEAYMNDPCITMFMLPICLFLTGPWRMISMWSSNRAMWWLMETHQIEGKGRRRENLGLRNRALKSWRSTRWTIRMVAFAGSSIWRMVAASRRSRLTTKDTSAAKDSMFVQLVKSQGTVPWCAGARLATWAKWVQETLQLNLQWPMTNLQWVSQMVHPTVIIQWKSKTDYVFRWCLTCRRGESTFKEEESSWQFSSKEECGSLSGRFKGVNIEDLVVLEICAGSARLTKAARAKGFKGIAVDHSSERSCGVGLWGWQTHKLESLLQYIRKYAAFIVAIWIAPSCGAASRARERPLPGGRKGPMPLRSLDRPDQLDGLSGIDKIKVEKANQL